MLSATRRRSQPTPRDCEAFLSIEPRAPLTMVKPAPVVANDGGVVVSLFFMVAAIAYAMFTAVAYYTNAVPAKARVKNDPTLLVRLLSGWANIGNAVIHAMLVIYMKANEDNPSEYWVKERALGGIEGPVFLLLLNLTAGLVALRGGSMKFPFCWNSFVACAGSFLPVVWPRFLAEGLATWPYIIIFIWFCIFAFELTAFTASATHFALKDVAKD